MAAHNPRRMEMREAERWLFEHVGDYETVERCKQRITQTLRRQERVLREEGYTGVYSIERTVRRAYESMDDRGFCRIGIIHVDPRPGVPGTSWEIWLNFSTNALEYRHGIRW